jgi:hypothetical protein
MSLEERIPEKTLINGLNDKNKAKINSIFVERSTQHNIGKK